MAKKTKAAIKWTITLTASVDPEFYGTLVEAVVDTRDRLSEIGKVTVTGPTHVRVEV